MIQTRLLFPLFNIGCIFLGIGSYIILHGVYFGFNDNHKYFLLFQVVGFWCIILSFFADKIENYIKRS